VSGKEEMRRNWLEAVERVERRKREEATKQERRRRRVLAKIGLTPEEFEEGVREFGRKFFDGS
jgi:hypothetical protein